MDNIQVTHNNDNHHFRIAMDIAKEGSSLWDLTPYVKGRVGDNRFGLQVTWTYQGQLMNIEGMKPYIEGNVGQYSVDDKNNLQLDPNSGVVRYVGDPADCQAGGQATYYFPEQMFPKEGIFKGYIGLLDDRDDSKNPHISGVTVWFKVLPGIAEMGHACDYYISDLEKAEEIFKAKLRQHETDFQNETNKVISDARNTYTSEVSNAHDALVALVSQIQANRDEQANLTNRLAGTEQQIETHDVVTRPEFLNLSNQLTQQVSQMKEAGLEFFNNADDLKAKYPQGANKLCVTLNDSHEWVYDYANNQWNDAGAFNYGTIDPKLMRVIYTKSPDNLIVNSDFDGLNMWTAGRSQTDPSVYIDTHDSINGSNALVMNGYIKDGSNNASWITSQDFSVDTAKNPTLSIAVEAWVQGINAEAGDTAILELDMVDKDENITRWSKQLKNNTDYQKITWENLILPANTVRCYIAIAMLGLGQVKIRRPQANFGSKLLPYSKEAVIKSAPNHFAASPITDWLYDNSAFSVEKSITYDGQPTLRLSTNKVDQWNNLVSPMIKVDPDSLVSVSVPLQGSHDYVNGKLYLEINQYDDYNSQDVLANDPASNFLATIPEDKFETYDFNNIKLNSTTHYITARIVVYGQADLYIGNIELYQNKYSYNTINKVDDYLSSKNCFFDYPINKWIISTASPTDVILDQSILDQNNEPTLKISTPNRSLDQNTVIQGTSSAQIRVDKKHFSFKLSYRQKVNENQGILHIGLRQYNSKNEPVDYSKELDFTLPNSDNLREIEFTNILLNDDTQYIVPIIFARGSIDANFGNFEQIENPPLEDKLVLKSNITNWNFGGGEDCPAQYSISRTDNVEINSNIHDTSKYLILSTPVIPVKGNQSYTFKFPAFAAPADKNDIYFAVDQGASPQDAQTPNAETAYRFKNNTEYQDYTFTLTTKPDTKFLRFSFVLHSAGLAKFGNFYLYLGTPNDIETDDNFNVLPQFNIQTDENISDEWAKAPFSYTDGKRKVKGYLQFAMQGDSSRSYPKKNLKLRFFSDENYKNSLNWKPKADWDKNNKYNLKANYIDATQARNLVNSKMFAKATAITPFEHASQKALLKTQNLGQMEGFPVELYFNGSYYGLMTFNTKKDDKPYGLDSNNPATDGIQCEQPSANLSDPSQKIDGNYYSTIVQDKASDTLQTNFTKFLTFISNSSDQDFKDHLHEYIDVKSVMNCILWGVLSHMYDYSEKSMIFLTWNNGTDFYMTLYDMDSTWNLYWNGSQLVTDSHVDFNQPTKMDWGWGNKLYSRIITNFKAELKDQYEYLRKNVWSNAQIISAFKKYINAIPEEAYEREQERWSDIPSKDITDFAQIQQSIIERGNAMDNYMQNLGSDTTDPTAK